MKRMISLLLAVMAVFTLAACGSKTSATVDAAGLADALAQRVQFDSEMKAVTADDLGFYIELPAKCEVGAYMSAGATSEEIFVIQCYDKTDAAAVKVSIQSYLDTQKQEAGRYQPDEVARLDGAIFETYGTCVVLCVTSDTSTASAVIKEYTA